MASSTTRQCVFLLEGLRLAFLCDCWGSGQGGNGIPFCRVHQNLRSRQRHNFITHTQTNPDIKFSQDFEKATHPLAPRIFWRLTYCGHLCPYSVQSQNGHKFGSFAVGSRVITRGTHLVCPQRRGWCHTSMTPLLEHHKRT